MLVRVSPEQVAQRWDLIRPMIVETLPSSLRVNADAMSNILRALMSEDAQFWTYYKVEGDGEPLAIAVTTVVTDKVVGARYLLIYNMFALAPLSKDDYKSGIRTLRKFAGDNRCKEVIAYVEDDRFVGVLKQAGGVKVTNLVRL